MKKQVGFFRSAVIVFSAVGFLLCSGLALAADEQTDGVSPGQSMMDGKSMSGDTAKASTKTVKKSKKAKKHVSKGKKKAKKAKKTAKSM